jgi:hypothetical protein
VHLHRVCVAQLVGREAATHSSQYGGVTKLRSPGRRRQAASAGRPSSDAEQWADRQLDASKHPRPKLFPAPLIHPHLASAPALAARDPRRGSRSASLSARASWMRRPAPPEHDGQSVQPRSVLAVSGVTHHRDDLLDGRRIGRRALALVARRSSSVESRHCRGRPTTASGIEQHFGHGASSQFEAAETGHRCARRTSKTAVRHGTGKHRPAVRPLALAGESSCDARGFLLPSLAERRDPRRVQWRSSFWRPWR